MAARRRHLVTSALSTRRPLNIGEKLRLQLDRLIRALFGAYSPFILFRESSTSIPSSEKATARRGYGRYSRSRPADQPTSQSALAAGTTRRAAANSVAACGSGPRDRHLPHAQYSSLLSSSTSPTHGRSHNHAVLPLSGTQSPPLRPVDDGSSPERA
jgi:hypothetical protein